MKYFLLLLLAAPTVDRVGFPEGYREKLRVLRTSEKPDKQEVKVIYGNQAAAAAKDGVYPYGSLLVMESRKEGTVTGLHVMRKERGFGEAYGPNRTGEKEQSHLHEAPWIMTGPLLVLGALSAAGGVINVPELYHGSALLHHWLEPIAQPSAALLPAVHLSPASEWLLVGIAVAVAVIGIVGAWRLLKPERLVPARSAPEERGFARVLRNKWYVDEIYDALIVRPLVWLSREVLWKQLDQRIIDGAAVNGAARGARALGWANRWLQTGQVGMYVAVFVVGVLLVLWRAMS